MLFCGRLYCWRVHLFQRHSSADLAAFIFLHVNAAHVMIMVQDGEGTISVHALTGLTSCAKLLASSYRLAQLPDENIVYYFLMITRKNSLCLSIGLQVVGSNDRPQVKTAIVVNIYTSGEQKNVALPRVSGLS